MGDLLMCKTLKPTLLAGLSLLLLPVFAFAWNNSGISAVKIERVVVLQDGTFYVHADKDLCDSGTANKIGYVYKTTTLNEGKVEWTKEGADMMLRVAVAAKLSGASVTVYADDSGAGWGCRMGAISLD